MKLVVNQSEKDVSDYQLGQQQTRVICDGCMAKMIAKLEEFDGPNYYCSRCKKRHP